MNKDDVIRHLTRSMLDKKQAKSAVKCLKLSSTASSATAK